MQTSDTFSVSIPRTGATDQEDVHVGDFKKYVLKIRHVTSPSVQLVYFSWNKYHIWLNQSLTGAMEYINAFEYVIR